MKLVFTPISRNLLVFGRTGNLGVLVWLEVLFLGDGGHLL